MAAKPGLALTELITKYAHSSLMSILRFTQTSVCIKDSEDSLANNGLSSDRYSILGSAAAPRFGAASLSVCLFV